MDFTEMTAEQLLDEAARLQRMSADAMNLVRTLQQLAQLRVQEQKLVETLIGEAVAAGALPVAGSNSPIPTLSISEFVHRECALPMMRQHHKPTEEPA